MRPGTLPSMQIDEANPYAAPAAPTRTAMDGIPVPVYSRGQVMVATFFGSLIAGQILMHANFNRLEIPRRPLVLVWVIGLPVLFGIAFLPGHIGGIATTLASMWAMHAIYSGRIDGDRRVRAIRKARRSHWAVFGWIIGGIAIAAAIGFAIGFVAVATGFEIPD